MFFFPSKNLLFAKYKCSFALTEQQKNMKEYMFGKENLNNKNKKYYETISILNTMYFPTYKRKSK